MSDILKYDTEMMRGQAKKLNDSAKEIRKAVNSMLENVATLKGEWVGDGATALFGKLDTNWQDPINKYAEMLRELSDALSDAAGRYDALQSDYAQIQAP